MPQARIQGFDQRRRKTRRFRRCLAEFGEAARTDLPPLVRESLIEQTAAMYLLCADQAESIAAGKSLDANAHVQAVHALRALYKKLKLDAPVRKPARVPRGTTGIEPTGEKA